MRKIDRETLKAVAHWKNYKSGNTEVRVNNLPEVGRACAVLLHDNVIYMKIKCENGKEMQLFTLAGWNTQTTRNRLNSLGITIKLKKGVPFWDNMEISAEDWYMF